MTLKKNFFKNMSTNLLIVSFIIFILNMSLIYYFIGLKLDTEFSQYPLNNDLTEVKKILEKSINQENNWSSIKNQLIKYNYQIEVFEDNVIIYNTLLKADINKVNRLKQQKINKKTVYIYHVRTSTILRTVFTHNNKEYQVFSVHHNENINYSNLTSTQIFFVNFMDKLTRGPGLFPILNLGSIIIFSLFLINHFLSKRFLNKIDEAIDKLLNASKNIKKGSLNQLIHYKGFNEFEIVCNSFNEMVVHLEQEKLKNKMYEKTRTDMMNGLIHDLKTPLTAIKGYSKGLMDGLANTEDKKERYYSTIYQRTSEIENFLNQLFSLVLLESSDLSFNFNKVRINEILSQYVEYLKSDPKYSSINISYSALTKDIIVNLDFIQFKRVIINIIENSIKYANNDLLEISITLKESKKNIVLSIKDNGVGVSTENIYKIFNQFYKQDESRTLDDSKSYGLGLYISKLIINKHNGKIFARNNNGLEVTIILPKLDTVNL